MTAASQTVARGSALDARATVVVLFADLVGSTQALAALAPLHAEATRREEVDRLVAAVRAGDGTLTKTLGDGIMATFGSADGALRAAVAMQRRAGRLAVRVGVSAGDAVPDDGDWHGRPVVEASRLCAAAAPGRILFADHVLVLADVDRSEEDVQVLQLRGLPAAVRAVDVDWRSGSAAPVRVVIADDSGLVRDGVAGVLESRGLEVVARCGDGDALVAAVEELRPDIVVTDVRMPPEKLGGLDAAERIRARDRSTGVLLLSTRVERHVAKRLMATGADGVGYLSKDRIGNVEELIAAIAAVAAGATVLDPALRTLVAPYRGQ